MTTVTTWCLEQTDAADLTPPRAPSPAGGQAEADPGHPDAARPGGASPEPAQIVRSEVPSPEFSRFLYTAVGGDWSWSDRLGWSHRRWQRWLERPGTETWVAWVRGTPAGYVELDAQARGNVEIAYFGLLPAFTGRGLGGRLLAAGTARAWDLADRWPGREPTRRVWVHTCSLDGPAALANYRARGFRLYGIEVADASVGPAPGPWPGAHEDR